MAYSSVSDLKNETKNMAERKAGLKYFAKIRFVGTGFSGFQVQPGARTVMGVLNDAMNRTLGTPCRVTGCSRTDAGVHALMFCVTIEAPGAALPPEKLPLAALPYLPPDLSLYAACVCPENFHPRYNAVGKTYRYTIFNRRIPDPFFRDRAWFLPRALPPSGIERMRAAAAYVPGRRDFASFMAAGSDVTDTVRTMTELSLSQDGDRIDILVSADGFLYHMVRILVGTLVDIGTGRFAPEDMPAILAAKNRAAAGMTAPASGLYLYRVDYGNTALSEDF